MTTTAMSCEFFNDHLMALLENEVDDATRAALEQHAMRCAECASLLADVRSLRAEAASLPKLTPSRDLWAGIAARIEAPVVPIGTAAPGVTGHSTTTRRWIRGALIAASLLGAMGLGYFAARRGQSVSPPVAVRPETVQVLATRPPDTTTATQTTGRETPREALPEAATPVQTVANTTRSVRASGAVATMTADYDREIARLRALIEQRRNQLDPATVAIIDRNMQVIDAAIVECKKAIARDPASHFLIESLNQSFQTKVELMRTAALLPSRT